MVERYMQSLREQQMEPPMLERFQRTALGHAAICVAQGQRFWLPERLANWLGTCSEIKKIFDKEVRLVRTGDVAVQSSSHAWCPH